MKQKLRLFSTLLLLAVASVGWGETGTITFSELGLENGVQYTDPFDGGGFTVTFAGGDNDGKYYTTGSGVRVYGGGTMTIASTNVITSIEITYDGNYKPNSNNVVNVGSYDNTTGVWTGSANSVVFTRPSGSGNWRVQKITVTYSQGEVPVDNRKETTITFPEETYEVTFGETFTAPTATVMAEGAAIEGAIVNYSSDNTSVATVNKTTGAVELVAAGNAVITATYEGDETNYKGSEGSYTLTVKNAPVEGQLFYESFDQSDGTGGRDDKFSENVGISSLEGKTDETWTSIGKNGAYKCIKLGTGSAEGTVKTRSIALNGNGELTFEAAGWESGTNTVTVSVEGATISGNSSFTLTNSEWNQYTVNLIDGNGEVYITFKMKRGFLDEIKVMKKAADPNFVATPTFSNEGGEVDYGTTVELSQADAASIIYTTDGTDPKLDPANGQPYSEPIAITSDMTIKAIAVSEAGYTSDVVSATFTVKRPDAPVFTPDGGVVESGAQVTITGNGTIYYTTDNSTPTVENGTKYTAPITITKAVTIKAIVVDEHGFVSRYATATFKLQGKLVNEDEEGNLHFDLTNNSWGFPTDYTTGTNQYTNSGYQLTLSAASNGYKFDGNGSYVIIGKNGATLTLPAFSFDVEKIEFVGRTGASGKVTTNIYVGEEAVSEEKTGSTGTSSFDIAADYQSAGNVYTLKVTNDNNFQITEIVVHKKLVTFDEKANNASDFAVVYDANVGENKNVKMLREFGSGYWNTLVVPFNLTRAQLEEAFGEGVQVAKYTDFNKPANIKFETVDGDVTRADLMIVKPAATVTNPIFKGVTLEKGKAYNYPSFEKNYSDTNFAINGRFAKQVLKDDDVLGKVYFLNKQGKFTHPTAEGNVIRGFRWFIQLKTPESSTGAKITLDVDGDVTSIDAIDNGQFATDAIYNLSGQRVNKAQKGIYIVNGKKVVVK